MADFYIPKGDYGFNIDFTVQDDDGDAFNLAGYTTKFKVWQAGVPGTTVINGTVVHDTEADGTCHYTVVSGDFDTVAHYKAELQLTKAGTAQESTRAYDLEVVESLST